MKWADPIVQLWIDRDDAKIADIYCIEHPQAHLGYASDIPALLPTVDDSQNN